MIVFPNAKINLGLYVTSKRPDNYHNLETVFYPIPLKDVLEVLPSEKLSFHSYGIPIPGNQDANLCIKAWRLIQNDFDITPVEIHLLKNIPMGAGLGGGSSDASFMLLLLNEMFQLSLSKIQLKEYAIKLGSDCPFFIENRPVFATGRGEIMERILLNLGNLFITMVYPEIHVSTAEAFHNLKPQTANFELQKFSELPISQWAGTIENIFEHQVFRLHPAIAEVKQELYKAGAVYAAMSGSGSAVYGLFESEEQAKTPKKNFRSQTFRLNF
ncbi:MAG: 4-(cytidine 5'-diphospho)-2-C-methyl-D-erythritol kinase [Bacteroidales bacterium]|nr:4-(cytidine 5'-diphospho)-2-C-methyl-D-erythritol kinase [Bacteroidales bacterium]